MISLPTSAYEAEKQRNHEKKKGLLILINHFLLEQGYIDTADKLQTEAGVVMAKYDIADNMDLQLILGEYEAYYEMRFDKKPKLFRQLKDGQESTGVARGSGRSAAASKSRKEKNGGENSSVASSSKESAVKTTSNYSSIGSLAGSKENKDKDVAGDDSKFAISGTNVGVAAERALKEKDAKEKEKKDKLEDRVLKPPPQFGGDMEMKQLANVISREIYQESPNVRFEDIVKLDEAKRLLAEAVQLPLKFPTLFTGILRPWRGILLHGPPGTGKTLLAKAVATECNTTFFNISASTLVSKWRGDSEKLVRALFELARYHSPSTIFLDEIDSILTSRSGSDGGGGEHEASRRMKTELLIQMDGVKGIKANEQVFLMAASNCPWDLDVAVLRRLEKRVLVSLPEVEAREVMIRKHLGTRSTSSDIDYSEAAATTEGYSGADIELVCREAAMMPIRRMMNRFQEQEYADTVSAGIPVPPPSQKPSGNGSSSSSSSSFLKLNNTTTSKNFLQMQMTALEVESYLKEDPVKNSDIAKALQTTKPSSDGNIAKYAAWQREFGNT